MRTGRSPTGNAREKKPKAATGNGAKSYSGISVPSETILFIDAARYLGNPAEYYRTDGVDSPSSYNLATNNTGTGWAHGRHGNKAQVGYVMHPKRPVDRACENYYYAGIDQTLP